MNVSRETEAKLLKYANLVEKWNPKINLVSRASLSDLWNRHITDSIQVFDAAGDLAAKSKKWIDLGSGGGFPGLVVSILANDQVPMLQVTLVESDQRKCAFLRTVKRELDLNCVILSERIERLDPHGAEILSARALADLTTLLEYTDRHLSKSGKAFLPKGATWENELQEAQQHWKFQFETITSKTDPQAVILAIEGLSRV